MQGIESAIRNALTKADASDPAMRQRIYESVWSAHERAMAANTHLSDPQRAERREKLKTVISQVEQEMRSHDHHNSANNQTPTQPYDGNLGMPELDRDDRKPHSQKPGKQPAAEADLGYEQDLSQRKTRKKRKKSSLVSLALPMVFLLTAAFIGWSVYNSFIAVGPGGGGPFARTSSLGPARDGDDQDRNWITIFTPNQPDRVSLQGRATAEIGGTGNARYLRVKSPTATDTVSFDVGEGVLQQLAGEQATFEIIMRSDEGGTVQMSVSCDFGSLGDCGRKRYDVTDQRSSLLFDLALPEVQSPPANGRIILSSDMDGSGKSIDVYAIRLKTAQ